jgi:hypothetical protein
VDVPNTLELISSTSVITVKRRGESRWGGFAADFPDVARLRREGPRLKVGGGEIHEEGEAIERGVARDKEAEQLSLLLVALLQRWRSPAALDGLGELVGVVGAGPQAIPHAVMAARELLPYPRWFRPEVVSPNEIGRP